MFVLGVLFMALAIGLSIALHEIGHLAPAKKFGVVCREYMIGFGPTLWSKKIGETEYGLKAVPLGGYVRMIGMYPPSRAEQRAARAITEGATPAQVAVAEGEEPGDGATGVSASANSAGRTRSGRRLPWSGMVEDARSVSLEEIRPGEEDRVFYKLAPQKKLLVMLGGPLMNLVIAAVVMTGVFTIHGIAEPVGAKVAAVAECVRPVTGTSAEQAEQAQQDPCTAADRPTPAAEAGMLPGDQILAIDGQPVTDPLDITTAVRPAAGRAVNVEVQRGDQRLTLVATPIPAEMPQLDENGAPVTNPDGTMATVTTGYLGMTSSAITEYVPQPITEVPGFLADGVVQTAEVVVQLPVKLVGVYEAAFGGAERDANGPMSVVGVGRIAGDVASGQVEWLTDPRAMMAALWMLVASLNIALFVFNMIPLLPLDGGHMVGAVWEWIRKGFAKVTGRPDPGYVDVAQAMPLAYVVSVLFLGMAMLLIYADVVTPIRL